MCYPFFPSPLLLRLFFTDSQMTLKVGKGEEKKRTQALPPKK